MWYLYTVFIRLTTLGTHLRLGTCLFCNKTVNSNNKMRRCNKARFLYTLKKLRLQESLLLELYQFGGGGGVGGRVGADSRLGAYYMYLFLPLGSALRWALI